MRPIRLPLAIATLFLAVLAFACSSGNAGEAAEKVKASAEMAATVAPEKIGFGEPVDIKDHLTEGQTTLVDFTSEFCPPCRQIAPYLDRLHADREDITVLKVDINRPGKRGIDWGSPVAKQYELSSIPHFRIYDTTGELVAEGKPAFERMIEWLQPYLEEEQKGAGR